MRADSDLKTAQESSKADVGTGSPGKNWSSGAPQPLSDHDFERFRDLLLQRTGMCFSRHRGLALARGVAAASARVEAKSVDEYYRLLSGNETSGELWDDLVSEVTVGETYFFRNESHMNALRTRILPDIINRQKESRRLRIWSAGCSSGEEPYTIAMLLYSLIPDMSSWNIMVMGTDINRRSLEIARGGVHGNGSFRVVPDSASRRRAARPALFAFRRSLARRQG